MGNTFNSLTVNSGNPDDRRNDEPTADELQDVPAIESNEQLLEVMRSKEYRESKLYRKLVHASLAKSASAVGITEQRQEKVPDVGNTVEARIEAAKSLFRDPRYRTSAVYRNQVAEMIKQQTAQELSPQGKTQRVEFSNDPSRWSNHQGLGVYRVEFEAQKTGMLAPPKAQPKPRDPNVIDLY